MADLSAAVSSPAAFPGPGAGAAAAAAARGKRRPSSPGNGSHGKKKRPATLGGVQNTSAETMSENKTMSTDSGTGLVETSGKLLPFKTPSFTHSGIGGAAAGKKNRTWKNLKQILASEKSLQWQLNDPSFLDMRKFLVFHTGDERETFMAKFEQAYQDCGIDEEDFIYLYEDVKISYTDFTIDAPPSFKPAKKYSDISGLPANYTDPQSKLRFSTIEEFAYIRMLPSDVVTGYLTLRKATAVVP